MGLGGISINFYEFLSFACPQKITTAFMAATKTWDVIGDCKLIFIPLVIEIQLFSFMNVSAGKEANVVIGLRVCLSS